MEGNVGLSMTLLPSGVERALHVQHALNFDLNPLVNHEGHATNDSKMETSPANFKDTFCVSNAQYCSYQIYIACLYGNYFGFKTCFSEDYTEGRIGNRIRRCIPLNQVNHRSIHFQILNNMCNIMQVFYVMCVDFLLNTDDNIVCEMEIFYRRQVF